MLTGLFMAFWWNTSADEYAITDEIFLMSVDHDIEKVNGLNQQLSNVIDYTLEWMENQKNNLKKKKRLDSLPCVFHNGNENEQLELQN